MTLKTGIRSEADEAGSVASMFRSACKYLAVVACLAASPTMAAQVVDQEYLAPSDSIYALPFSFEAAGHDYRRFQTVTVGVAGRLSQVDVQYQQDHGEPTFTGFNVYATGPGGVPTYTLLGSGFLIAEGGGWASFSTDVAVSPGRMIALEPTYTFVVVNTGWLYHFNHFDEYAGGALYDAVDTGAFFPEGYDVGFRTYVTPAAAIPEPATWALFIAGFGLVAGAMRRRHRPIVHLT